ncbi:MAG: sn-glycerol-3-phosphate ABC transporter permease UgpE [Rhodospirillales bacterium]
MVENRPWLTFITHAVLLLGVAIVLLPLWIAFVASTHSANGIMQTPIPWWPGDHMLENYHAALFGGIKEVGGINVAVMLVNSTIMALAIACGKIFISLLSAYAIVYFRFPFRMTCFWIIFVTLMLPVEVRILPTFQVIADLGMLDSYAGLSIPLIASATATFLFRQFFLTVPDEYTEAARIDGAGPVRFFFDILLPLSRTNIAALFVILFIYGWNQYLWPLLITTDESYYTVVMGIQRMVSAAEQLPVWNHVMATAMLAMLPPALIVILMQRQFIKGLIETEK